MSGTQQRRLRIRLHVVAREHPSPRRNFCDHDGRNVRAGRDSGGGAHLAGIGVAPYRRVDGARGCLRARANPVVRSSAVRIGRAVRFAACSGGHRTASARPLGRLHDLAAGTHSTSGGSRACLLQRCPQWLRTYWAILGSGADRRTPARPALSPDGRSTGCRIITFGPFQKIATSQATDVAVSRGRRQAS